MSRTCCVDIVRGRAHVRPRDRWTAGAAAGIYLSLAAVGDPQHPGFTDVFDLVAASILLFVAIRFLRHIERFWWKY